VELTPWDMIPLSDSVETLAILRPAAPAALNVLHEDATLLAVEQSPYWDFTPEGEGSLLGRVRLLPGNAGALPVPGLEPEASGVRLFARRPEVLGELGNALFLGQKEYSGLVRGIIRSKGRIQRAARDGRGATRYRRERVVGTHSLVRAFPEAGQPSRLRQHLANIGHPVLGDARFGDAASNRYFDERHGLDRLFLHCARLVLQHAGRELVLESALAPDLAAVLEGLASPSIDANEAASRSE